jgi:hypothetical protein
VSSVSSEKHIQHLRGSVVFEESTGGCNSPAICLVSSEGGLFRSRVSESTDVVDCAGSKPLVSGWIGVEDDEVWRGGEDRWEGCRGSDAMLAIDDICGGFGRNGFSELSLTFQSSKMGRFMFINNRSLDMRRWLER